MVQGINVYSEIGKLNRVLLHRLGREIEGLVPDNFERLLFDEIPYLEVAQKEHDCFANVLRENNVEVLYFADEVILALEDAQVRREFIKEFLNDSDVFSSHALEAMEQYLMDMPVKEMVESIIAGIKKEDVHFKKTNSLADYINEEYPYYTDPMPNLYFTRDPGACIGNGVSIHCMKTKARKREALMLKYIYLYNKSFMPEGTERWYDYEGLSPIEGGDILVLSPQIVAVGLSQRTSADAIEILAERLLNHNNSFRKILVFEIPKCRAFMHLDTVFTMVDYDKFTIHPEIEGPLHIYEVTLDKERKPVFKSSKNELETILKRELKLPAVQMIRCGGSDRIAAQREQWSDASNTLAIAPGTVITYDRNHVTNDLLDRCGVKVMTIPSSELSRGRGGPRCMSMPIHRD
ncbi:MAG: arginine deiminase [Bacillota bacterium]|jgi:arginine deiminase|nr:arginine deiminase [Bacillota bacterium]